MTRLTRPVLSILTALAMVGTLFVGAPAPAFAADPPIIYYIAQSGIAALTPGDGTSCAAPDYVEDPAGDDHASISSALAPASNGDTIYLCAGTYDIGTSIDLAGETITLQGAAAATTILDGGGATRILTSSGAITVSDLTFQNGWNFLGVGGAIFAAAIVTVSNSTYTNNTALYGGAIYAGTATVSNSTFTGNTASFSDGGAIYATTATVTDSSFTDNTAYSGGGAIHANSTVTVSDSTFANNDARYGGAIYANTVTVTSSTLTGNAANFDDGGAIYSSSTATVTDSNFTGNAAYTSGGAIRAYGTATVSDSTFANNDARYGGAIIADSTTATITRSRFTRNTAGEHGGAMFLYASNSVDLRQPRGNTFMRNTAPAGGAITFESCGPAFNRSLAARVERANRFSGNRATEQRRTNSIERLEGIC